nr:MAG TPA: Cytosine specific methyltransferase [Caudoviricetes sp.]
MNQKLTLGSLFDGSGGFPLGGLLSGITPVWASEIEPFPIRVTTKRLPFMKHYGDISTMDGGKIEPVDIITFGSPCTDMSVAGKRAGLEGQQSVLFYQAIRIIKEMRSATNGKYPRYIVWENVPGAFSSNGGEDFKAVLEAVIGIAEPDTEVPMPEKGRWPYADAYLGDGFSVAYRTLDAQYWGVPQRRRRIYLVADFAGRSAPDILFKSEGLSRYSSESFRAWKGTACRASLRTGTASICLNDQGGNRMDVTDDVTATLRAEAHHPPVVMESAGFCTEHSAKSRTIGYEEETSPTLRAGVVPAAVALENHPADSRVTISDDDKVQTLTSRMGTGGGNVPLVMSDACTWDGGQTVSTLTAHNAGGNQRMPDKNHFNCVIQAYGISAKDSNAMKSANPHSGIYEADTSRTLDGNGGNPGCNQGGIAVVCVDQGGGKSSCSVSENVSPTLACTHGGEPAVCVEGGTIVIEGNGARPSHKGDGYKESDVMYTLNTVDRHAVYAMTTGSYAQISKDMAPTLLSRDYKDATVVTEPVYGIGRDAFNQGKNAQFTPTVSEETQPTLVAKGPGAVATPYGFDPSATRDVGQYFLEDCGNTLVNGTCPGHHNGVVEATYTVRRLTPTECARLQGFPDWWCDDLGIAEPTMEDIRYWYDVFETHRKIMGTSTKPKTLKQIKKWLLDPHSDAAEYKMWGNGVALPCVFFVLSGIVWCTQNKADYTAD